AAAPEDQASHTDPAHRATTQTPKGTRPEPKPPDETGSIFSPRQGASLASLHKVQPSRVHPARACPGVSPVACLNHRQKCAAEPNPARRPPASPSPPRPSTPPAPTPAAASAN